MAQRNYAPNSVLANGNWYRMGVLKEGVYKVDINLFTSMGITTTNLSSSSIRLYGNGGDMLAEDNSKPRIDDLFENVQAAREAGLQGVLVRSPEDVAASLQAFGIPTSAA